MAIYRYKLTTQEGLTQNNTSWEIGKTNEASGSGIRMCSSDVLHCYTHPGLAIILNPHHANIPNPRLFRIRCSKIVASDNLKEACKKQTPVKELPIPEISLNQKIAFGIKCALLVCKSVEFVTWAEAWLSGEDRSAAAAYAAAYAAAHAAAYAAAYAAARAARAAADAAAYAAAAAAHAAADAARAAAYAAARAAADDAADAAYAAAYAAADAAPLNFVEILDWVLSNIN